MLRQAQVSPVILLSWALMVLVFWQAGTVHSFTSPLHAADASSMPLGENWHAHIGRSSPNSLLCMPTEHSVTTALHMLYTLADMGE